MWPIIFEIGPFTVYSLWLMTALGLIAGTWTLIHLSQKSRLKIDLITNNSLFLLVGTLICSRLFFIISHPTIFFPNFSIKNLLGIFAIWDKGLSFWGAIIGFLLIFYYIALKEEENIKRWLDIITISILVVMIFGHIGAFLDGINYGRETNMPWGITFESSTVKYVVPIHPTQIYALIYTSILAFVLYEIYKKWKVKRDGLVAEIGITSYFALRTLEEFFRGDEVLEVIGIKVRFAVFLLSTVILAIWLYLQYGKYRNKIQRLIEKAKKTATKIPFLKK